MTHPELYIEECNCDRCCNIREKARIVLQVAGEVNQQQAWEGIVIDPATTMVQELTKNDPVNHPKHYTSHPSGIECIEITRHYNFDIGNAIKYLWRNGLKDGESDIQDLKKAIWYINDEIAQREKCATNLTKQK